MMSNAILLAIALQYWEQYSAHALAARSVVSRLARGTSILLHVLSVYDYVPINAYGLPCDIAAEYRDEQMQRIDAGLEHKIHAYVAPLKAVGLQIATTLRVGNPRQVIVQVAAEIKAELLIIGTHSKRSRLDVMLGGTAHHISKRAPCAVLLV